MATELTILLATAPFVVWLAIWWYSKAVDKAELSLKRAKGRTKIAGGIPRGLESAEAPRKPGYKNKLAFGRR